MTQQAKGVRGTLGVQYEEAFGVDPGTPDLTKIRFSSEGFQESRAQESSDLLTGDRFETEPDQGAIEASGSIATELGAYPGILFAAAAGSVKTEANSGSGEVLAAALAAPTGVIDDDNQTLTITQTTHGIVVGDSINIAGITVPTDLNDTYVRCMKVVDADNFVCRLPLGVSGTFTVGAGTLQKVTTPADTYQHTLKFGGKLPSLLVEKAFQDIGQFFKYNGDKVSKMSLSLTPSGAQKISFDFAGQKETVSTTSFDAVMTDLGKKSFSGFTVGTIEEGGSTIADVTAIDIGADNDLDTGQHTIGGEGLVGDIPEGTLKVSGKLDALFKDVVLYNKAKNSTESSLKVGYVLGTGAGTAGNEALELLVPELKYAQETAKISGSKGVLVSCPWSAYVDDGSEGTSLQIILKNAQLAI